LPEISEADADSDQLINFLITEWNMPGMPCMPGLEMLKHVRADARLAQLPLLMLTAEAKREQIVEGAHASVNAYVIKSFAAATLNEKIAKILAAQANCDVSRAADQSGAVS
jgi:two-component system chemotaxis response regulator CheY